MAVVSLLGFENVDDEKGGDDDLLDHIDGMHESLAMNVHGDMR